MTIRVNAATTEMGESAEWTPAAGTSILLQAQTTATDKRSNLRLQLLVRLNTSVDYVAISAWPAGDQPLLEAARFPYCKLAWTGNTGALTVFDSEA